MPLDHLVSIVMPRFAANISTLFTEYSFVDRITAAADCGFEAVECQFPYDTPAKDVAAALRAAGVEMVLVNAPPGDRDAGDRGLAAVAGRDDEFRASIEVARRYAVGVGCRRVHVMAGCPTDPASTDRFAHRIGWAADELAADGIDVMLEPMSHRDVPGYLLRTTRQTERVIAATGRPNVKLQFDTYHLQINEGDLLENFARCRDVVGHVQFSSLPGRHEPDEGEVAHYWLFEQLEALGYQGWMGAEYRPRTTTIEGLGWAARYGFGHHRPSTTT